MRTVGVSSAAVSQALRYSLLRAQTDLNKAQQEAQSGRVSDIGLALGARSAQSVSFTRDLDRIQGIVDSNGLITARLAATQDVLKQVGEAAQTFLNTLTTSVSGDALGNVTHDSAKSMLDSLTNMLNTSFNGEHLFAGINTDVKPVNSYTDPGSPAKAAFDAAFQAHFGFAADDPAAAAIATTDMEAFMVAVEPQFLGAGWQANWSNAADQRIVSRITLTETAETSVNANNEGMRKLAMAATMIMDLFNDDMSAGAKKALVEKAVTLVGDAVGRISDLQATTGVIEKRVNDASERLNVQIDLFERRIGNLLEIDPYEASTRVSDLLSHIETSYALTARIQQLSLIRFI